MITIIYGEKGKDMSLQASGHAGYAPKGQDIVCAAVSTLMQSLAYSVDSGTVTCDPGGESILRVQASRSLDTLAKFELVTDGLMLLAQQYPANVQFVNPHANDADNMDLQLFAEGEGGAAPPPASAPALSRAQQQQAIASGTMKAAEAEAPAQPPREAVAEEAGETEQPEPAAEPTAPEVPETRLPPRLPAPGRGFVEQLHAQWAAEEALLRRDVPGFSLKAELRDPEMRRLMQLPGMRLGDAYRLAHYSDALRQTARTVEQGVVERIRQRASRPAENGTRPGSAAVTRADVASMTRAQREALERQALHGVQIKF